MSQRFDEKKKKKNHLTSPNEFHIETDGSCKTKWAQYFNTLMRIELLFAVLIETFDTLSPWIETVRFLVNPLIMQ